MLFLCFYTLYFLTVFFVYVHICIVCYPCGVTINDDDDDDTRCYFNVRSKANMSQLNLPHGLDLPLPSTTITMIANRSWY